MIDKRLKGVWIVAMRGRNPENPNSRIKGDSFEQRLEPNSQGITNTVTTVSKDNLVLEKGSEKMAEKKKTVYKIRKLTPKECFRLMDVTDENADKMLEVNSNSQCYKQAGNSIVVACLIALFSQLNICQNGIQLKTWNEGLYKDLGYDKDEVGGGSSITV